MLKTTDRHKLFLSSQQVRLMQSVFSFNCFMFSDFAQPVNDGICLIWLLLLSDIWFGLKIVQFDMTHSLWCQQQKIWRAFSHSIYKIRLFLPNYMVCWIVLFVFSIVTCCFLMLFFNQPSREVLCVWMLFSTGRGQQCAALWARRTATTVFFTRRPAAKNDASARHILEPVLVHTHRHTKHNHA